MLYARIAQNIVVYIMTNTGALVDAAFSVVPPPAGVPPVYMYMMSRMTVNVLPTARPNIMVAQVACGSVWDADFRAHCSCKSSPLAACCCLCIRHGLPDDD
jgi:hypothetical protein